MQEPAAARCPECGSALSDEPWAQGLCLSCLARLAADAPSLFEIPPRAAVPDEDLPTLEFADSGLSEGRILGDRYRVRSLLGRGGMGEIWRAYDLKLRVDVALKALRPQLLRDARALEALRQEVRSAREVVSPNVCRVFDLIELDGKELVSMEYIDGITLADILKARAPLDIAEAREIAAQFLAGLEAIHEAHLVHRDMKPENIMMTRSGRVVVMDFGIAKGLTEAASGTISGTPAYMAPEQMRGEAVDARADVFSAGVVLAEMVAPAGLATQEARAVVWEAIHRQPPDPPESAWAPVIREAVAHNRKQRYGSALALARALEEVTLRVEGAENVEPYPGLAAFTEEDAEYFFGRELEVEEMWKKLRRPHLLGLIGPSGAGKSSFVRAGLLKVVPTGWRVAVITPGNRPFMALSQALVPEFSGDEEAMKRLIGFEELDTAASLISEWRRSHDQVLIVVDQFEELFTQNPEETQLRFAELLGRLALEADAHVLLSMRDDFLFHCQRFESLKPLFSELTPLGTLSGGALRRALVQPALKCGYRFEDDALVDEMVGEVAQERGALPMLAFAAARLWDHRDRDEGLLTREAYEHIGGVGGALAQHAEATLEKIGQDRMPVVRELFRNLVTSQGTRVARDRAELLSVFETTGASGDGGQAPFSDGEEADLESLAPRRRPSGERGACSGEATEPEGPPPTSRQGEAAAEVLDTLIDARLLTSYEVPAVHEGDPPQNRIEIVHESLLSNWPRLVHWQAQDEEGALLRDQLRQAAQMWQERGRPEDLLWTGTSFKEYELWRERYSGGITSAEEQFAEAMVAKSERNRRRKRLILAAVIVVLAVGLSVVAGLWRSADRSRRLAEAETRRAEASKLLALARLELDTYPTGALAFATKSLELADTPEARRFALSVLWQGPVARILEAPSYKSVFSPDGRWLAVDSPFDQRVRLVSVDGEVSEPIGRSDGIPGYNYLDFSAEGDLLVRSIAKLGESGHIGMKALERWTIPDLEALPILEWDREVHMTFSMGSGLPLWRPVPDRPTVFDVELLPAPPFPHEIPEPVSLGRLDLGTDYYSPDASHRRIFLVRNRELFVRFLGAGGAGRERRLGTSDRDVRRSRFSPDASLIVSFQHESEAGDVWKVDGEEQRPWLRLDGNRSSDPLSIPEISSDDASLVMASSSENAAYLWDLETPLDGSPLLLRTLNGSYNGAFHPEGRWIVTTQGPTVAFWPLDGPHARVVDPHEDRNFVWLSEVAFSPDSQWLASCSNASGLHLWPLKPGLGDERTVANGCLSLAFSPATGELVTARNRLHLGSIGEAEPERTLDLELSWPSQVAVDLTGSRVAAALPGLGASPSEIRLLVWDLETDAARVLDVFAGCEENGEESGSDCLVSSLGFGADGSLYTGGRGGIRRWDVATGEVEWIQGPSSEIWAAVELSADGRYLLTAVEGSVQPEAESAEGSEGEQRWLDFEWSDLEAGDQRRLEGLPIADVSAMKLDPSGRVYAFGTESGEIWVGDVAGGEPHLLLGNESAVIDLAVSADGRWIASMTSAEIRMWPMPDLEKTPFHTLPYRELLDRLHALTNVRAIEDPSVSTGWSLEVGPFPGWEEVPSW